MALHLPDFVRVTIDGTDRTAYVISYARHSSLCSFSDTFTLEMSFEIPNIPDPYDTILIRELYGGQNEKVIGGYIIDVIQDFDRGTYIINGQDKTLLLDDYFIHTQHYANNETVGYWMNWYAGLVGLTIQYDSSVSQFIVEESTPMGMTTASEGIALLERLAAVYIKYDAEIDKLRVFRINTSEPVINITNNSTTTFSRELGTEDTRNVVKVFGGYQYNIFTGTSTQVFATARTSVPELIVDKIAVMANPYIKRTTIAGIVASRILQIVDDVDDVVIIETAGFYPFVDVGEHGSINIGRGDFTYSADREITSIQTVVDENGAITIFTVGEKCPRVSIMPPLSVVYATARNAGVLVSWDGGDSFEPFNRGIVTTTSENASGINGYSVAANKYGQLMSIVDDGLYKRTGKYGSWSQVTLPNPSNDEGIQAFGVTDLSLQKVEKESGYYNKFHVLANATVSGGGGYTAEFVGQNRCWIYWTQSFGNVWDSMQLYMPGSGIPIGNPSGLPVGLINGSGITQGELVTVASGAVTWNVRAVDMECSYSGGVTVLVAGAVPAEVEQDPLTIYVAENYLSNQIRLGYWDGTTVTLPQTAVTIGFVVGVRMWSCPTNRDIAYMACVSNDGPTSAYYGGHTYVWRTIDGGDSWTKVHDVQLVPTSGEAMISSYTVNFDPSSSESEVRVAFCSFRNIGNNTCTAKARFVTSSPTGSTSYTDTTSSVINLIYSPYIGGGEYFDGWAHNNNTIEQNFAPAWKNAVVDNYTWAGAGFYGRVRLTSDNTWVATLQCAVVVRLNFPTKSVAEFNQKTTRSASLFSAPPRAVLCSARSLSSVYIYSIGGLSLISSSTWSVQGFATVNPYNDFNGAGGFDEVFMGYKGFPQYTFRTVARNASEEDTSFYPNIAGWLSRLGACQLSKQFNIATNHWCQSDTAVLSDPFGFCYSPDGVNWTQHWNGRVAMWDFAWRTWE